jgi:hypothetical protein
MEGDVSFHLLHHLVYMFVEDGYRTESLDVSESLLAILRSPSPFGIYRPKRDMREQDDRCASGLRTQVVFEPFQLARTQLAQLCLSKTPCRVKWLRKRACEGRILPKRFARNEQIQDSTRQSVAIGSLKSEETPGAAHLFRANNHRPAIFRLRAARNGDGDRPLAG